jgi:hypothetical protein
LFEEGLQLARGDKWAEAAEHFRRALELKESAVLSYNLAIVLGKLGQVVEASELLLRVVHDPQARPDIKSGAQLELGRVQPRIGKLNIAVRGELGSGKVSLDEHVLDAAALGVLIPMNPGRHTVVLSDASTVVQRVEISVPEAGEERVELTVPEKVASAPLPTASEAARTLATPQPSAPIVSGPGRPADRAGDTTVWESPWLWAGVGGAAAVTVAVLVLLSVGNSNSAQTADTPVRGNLGAGTIVIGGAP